MGNVILMKIIQTLKDLSKDDCGFVLRKEAFLNNSIEQLASFASFGNDVELFLIFEPLKQLEHIWMVKLL